PLKRALTGPTLTLATACSSVSESFSRLSQPGIEALSVSASLRRAHTVALSAGSTTSPDIVTAMGDLQASPSPHTSWGEGRGEGQRQTPTSARVSAPHPNPLPACGERGLYPALATARRASTPTRWAR